MLAVPDVRQECLHERLYEVGDVIGKLIGRAITCADTIGQSDMLDLWTFGRR